MKTVFIGGVEVSWHSLKALCNTKLRPSLIICYDYTLKDRSGWDDLSATAVNESIPFMRTTSAVLAAPQIALIDPDYIFCIGWSEVLPKSILDMAKIAVIGIHPTPLPEGRGGAPVPNMLMRGWRSSAATMYIMDEGIDTGDIIGEGRYLIDACDTATDIHDKLNEIYPNLIRLYAPMLAAYEVGVMGKLTGRKQKDAFYPPFSSRKPKDSYFDPQLPFEEAYNKIRALADPYPNAWTIINDRKVRFDGTGGYKMEE